MQILRKKNISLFLFLFVNFIFSAKYLNRITPYYLLLSILITSIYFFVWHNKIIITQIIKPSDKMNYFVIIIFIIASFIVFKLIPAEKLNVDRWSVIISFWDNYFNNKYVYFAKSNLNNPPGPMPFYFILALPFYLIGELGYFSILGSFLFFLIIKYSKVSVPIQTITLLLLTTSTFFLWEVICRSNIFLNGVLVLMVINQLFQIKIFNLKNYIFIGTLIGLCLSTRNIFIIPFIIAFLFALNKKILSFKQIILIGSIAIFIFALTFLPFVWNHSSSFKKMNPFIIQSSSLMPFILTIPFILLGAFTGLLCKKMMDVYFYSGLILFLTIIGYFSYHIAIDGFCNTLFESTADISYFILCIPFSLFYLIQETKSTKLSCPKIAIHSTLLWTRIFAKRR